jgi:hypothetical protein
MQLGDQFDSINAARDAIKTFVLDQGESFKTVASDKHRYIIRCKDKPYNFRIRATLYKKKGNTTPLASITQFKPHTCSPIVHYHLR